MTLALAWLLAAALPIAVDERVDHAPVEWVAADGSNLAWGNGTRLSVRSPDGLRRQATLDAPVRDGILVGSRLVLSMADGGGAIVELEPAAGPLAIGRVTGPPALHGDPRTARVGRVVWLASPEGLVRYRDRSPAAQTFPIAVGSDFFSPAAISIDTGDTLQWTNADGFHNVYSCVADQTGCDGQTANETFVSGPPAFPVWFYSYTFTRPGSNPYLCQSHATSMFGLVEVDGPLPPPIVPDGIGGAPLLVSKIAPGGAALELTWDAFGCGSGFRRHVVFGFGADLPQGPAGSFTLAGSRCNLTTPFAWDPVPDPAADPDGLLWWVVVAGNSAGEEGSWGDGGDGSERLGPGPGGSSGECGAAAKNTANPCGG